jgi:hypothetical protein
MQQARSPRSVAVIALAAVLILVGVIGLISRPFTGSAFAEGGAPWHSGGWHGGGAWPGKADLPPELVGLMDVPSSERFSHFRGVQVQLTDKDNRPLRVDVTPGTITSISASSLTIAGNDGASHTYALDSRTIQRGNALQANDKVVVASVNGSSTATGVFAFDGDAFGPKGPWGR